jgi:8-oxo-dGTP diphosphatase
MRHRISAGAIIQDEAGRLLLVHSVLKGRYDFWVCPGGGVKDMESLEDAARREVREESGLEVAIGRLLYIEELSTPECRFVKFWFLGSPVGGRLDVTHPEAIEEHITEVAWLSLDELDDKTVFPVVVKERLRADLQRADDDVVRLPLREMPLW